MEQFYQTNTVERCNMERDSRGRFLPGNQVAKGNRGNRKPKYGNSNALKHGLRRGYTGLLPSREGGVSIYKNGAYLGTLPDKYFNHSEDGALWVDYSACQYLVLVCGLPESMFSEPEEWQGSIYLNSERTPRKWLYSPIIYQADKSNKNPP